MNQQNRHKFRWLIISTVLLFVLAACTTTTGSDIEPVSGEAAVISEDSNRSTPPTEEPTDEPKQELEEVEEATALPETAPATPTETNEEEPAEEDTEEAGGVIKTIDDRSDSLRNLTSSWGTNWAIHTIDYGEILSGGPPRDGIPSIDSPKFVSTDEAGTWLADTEPVIFLERDGDVRGYPLQILTWHEIVNDTVGSVPVVITFCPLCNSALVFDRRVDGEVFEFGTSGLLRNSDLIMYDRTNESLWQQFTGDAIVGDKVGTQLVFVPSSIISFADFKGAHPDGLVLSQDTGFARSYGENPYVGYDSIGQNPFLFTGELDGRLPAMARVVTISLEEIDLAYPLDILTEAGVINDSQGGQDLAVFHTGGTASALGARVIAEGDDVGATGVFDPNLDGQKLTFSKEDDVIVDTQTGSIWNILGTAVDGPLAGQQLTPIVHADHFWFSWAAFRPDTIIFDG